MSKLNANTLKVVAAAVKSNPRKLTARAVVASFAEKLGGVGVVRAALATLESKGAVAYARVAGKGKAKGHFVLVPAKA